MRHVTLLSILAATVFDITAELALAQARAGRARLSAKNGSGIRARITFVDSGSTLHVVGIAKGMEPSTVYETLIYDNGARTGGPRACLPSQDPSIPGLEGPQMFVGFWEPLGSGTRVLQAVKRVEDASYSPLGTFATGSVREFFPQGPPPDNSDLRACGRVRRSPAR